MIEVTEPPVDLNFRDDTMNMNTALHMACANGHAKIAAALLGQKSLDTDLINDTGNTALHYSAINGHASLVELLLEHKANANIKNEFGRIPLEDAL